MQRTQNCLTTSNIQLSNVVSDIYGKSSQKIIAKILDNPTDTTDTTFTWKHVV